MSFEKYNNGKYARYTSGGMPLVTTLARFLPKQLSLSEVLDAIP